MNPRHAAAGLLLAAIPLAPVAAPLAQTLPLGAHAQTPEAASASDLPDAPLPLPGAAILQQRALRFVPLADGREAVFEGRSNRLVYMLGTDKNKDSFLRVTIRILQVTRQHRSVDTRTPFLLVVRADTGLTLEDPLTRSSLPVRAFGETQFDSVNQLLTAPARELDVLPATCKRLEC